MSMAICEGVPKGAKLVSMSGVNDQRNEILSNDSGCLTELILLTVMIVVIQDWSCY